MGCIVELGESEYKKDTMMCQAGNKRDWMVVLVYFINFYNVQNLICLTPIAKSTTYDY